IGCGSIKNAEDITCGIDGSWRSHARVDNEVVVARCTTSPGYRITGTLVNPNVINDHFLREGRFIDTGIIHSTGPCTTDGQVHYQVKALVERRGRIVKISHCVP